MQFCSWLILLVAVESHSNSTATTKGFWSPICYVCCILLAAFIVLMQHNTRALVAWGHAIFNIKRIYTRLTKTMLFQLNMGTKMLMLVSYKSCLPHVQDILVPGGYTQCSIGNTRSTFMQVKQQTSGHNNIPLLGVIIEAFYFHFSLWPAHALVLWVFTKCKVQIEYSRYYLGPPKIKVNYFL